MKSFTICNQMLYSLHAKIAELICGEALFDNRFEEKDDIIDEWIGVFGNLPQEWKIHHPPRTADC